MYTLYSIYSSLKTKGIGQHTCARIHTHTHTHTHTHSHVHKTHTHTPIIIIYDSTSGWLDCTSGVPQGIAY